MKTECADPKAGARRHRLALEAAHFRHARPEISNPEIATALQVPLATIKSRVHRARLFVRSQLSAYLGPPREPA